MEVTKKVNQQNHRSKSFAWSLKPIFYLIIVIAGLKLDASSFNSVPARRFICALGFLLVLSNILVNGFLATYNLHHAIGSMLEDLNDTRRTATETVDVECRLQMAQGANYYYRYLLLILGVPIIFTFHLIMTDKWKNLWSNLQAIQLEMKLSKEFYGKCRKRCYLGLLLFCLVRTCY